MERWIAIVNPNAGGGRCSREARSALYELRERGLAVAAIETRGPRDASRIAREAFAEGHRNFLSLGGDGTHFEVVNGLFPAASDVNNVKLGLLPCGTGNSYLRDFGILSVDEGISAVSRGALTPSDVVRVTHREGVMYFVNLLSIGFTATAGALTNERFKPFGAAGYVAAVLMSIARLNHPVFPHRVDGAKRDERPCTFIAFSNSRYTGGSMMMAPAADVTDGALDIVRLGPLSRFELFRDFPKIFRGTHTTMKAFEHRTAACVELELDGPVDVMVDGEVLKLWLERLEVMPHALQVAA